ncbi:MAG: hypothetical protein RR840_03915 [Clostridium sp.]
MEKVELIAKINKEEKDFIRLINESEFITLSYGEISSFEKKIENIGHNNYEKLLNGREKQGLYIFYLKDEILYVGENHMVNEKWDLSERLKQHFKIGDKGGLLYKFSNGNKEIALRLRNSLIANDVKLTYFTFNDRKTKQEILFFESYLIGVLKPKYNFII